jgi:L-cysteine:1D-myo-inositol 2-amino-2-deoxy-alpha-D-glucopyranoside ligase
MTALQEKARSGSAFAEIFVHTGMIRYQGEKMSKSLGNLVFVSELIGRGIPPMAIRLALLSGHYGNERDWNDALLAEAQDLYQRLLRVLSRDRVLPYDEVLREVLIALSDNLDTPKALLALKRYVERVETSPNEEASDVKPGALSRFLDTVLGVAF